jgi:hypothetical protein
MIQKCRNSFASKSDVNNTTPAAILPIINQQLYPRYLFPNEAARSEAWAKSLEPTLSPELHLLAYLSLPVQVAQVLVHLSHCHMTQALAMVHLVLVGISRCPLLRARRVKGYLFTEIAQQQNKTRTSSSSLDQKTWFQFFEARS